MKKSEIKIGGLYLAKVSGSVVTVRVDEIKDSDGYVVQDASRQLNVRFHVTNLTTGRKTVFKSAGKFRSEAKGPSITIPREDSAINESLGKKPDNAPHVIIIARAGTGKTTTGICGLEVLKGKTPSLTPSPQQAAVWEEFKKSKDARTIAMVAFNKSIATELQSRVPEGVDAMTLHSLGYGAVRKSLGYQQPNSFTVQDAIAEIEQRDIRELRKYDFDAIKATEKLVGLAKQNLLGWDGESFDSQAITDDDFAKLASYYDVDLNGGASKVYRWTRECLDRSLSPQGKISFDDMIWLPIVLNLSVNQYDLLFVDEAQDLNRCQQALAKKSGSRLIFCGDDRQAIYGFAGADSESLKRLETELGETDRGVTVLPLTVTRRCGKAIVYEAQKIVPDFEAHESNSEGIVSFQAFEESRCDCENGCDNCKQTGRHHYSVHVQPGDMCLCRVNAPLVSECFKFLKDGRKANIQGRDVGQGLISTIKKLKATDIVDLSAKLSDWLHSETQKENAKRNPNEARLIALQDRSDCLGYFMEGQSTIESVISRIESVFTDDKTTLGIMFSSVHKSKGLEAFRIFLLEPEKATIPHPMAKSEWQRGQEWNLRYVAITRAIGELVYVK